MKAQWSTCTCGVTPEYCARYDAAYCVGCDLWLEQGCGFPAVHDCFYECADRPERPSMLAAEGWTR